MPHLGYTTNEYGTRVSKHKCDACGQEYTVCPPCFPEENRNVCQAKSCPSYDPACDVDAMFERGDFDNGTAVIKEGAPKGRA
jgi:hypothetical protein